MALDSLLSSLSGEAVLGDAKAPVDVVSSLPSRLNVVWLLTVILPSD